jgi:hypothetical protein
VDACRRRADGRGGAPRDVVRAWGESLSLALSRKRERGHDCRRFSRCSFFVLDKIPVALHTRSRLVREGRSHEAFFEWDRMRCLRPVSQAGLGRPGVTVPPHYEGEPIGRLRRHRRTAGKPSGSTEPKLRESKEYGTCRCATERSSSPKSRGGTPSGVARLKFAGDPAGRGGVSNHQVRLTACCLPSCLEGKLLKPRTLRRRENESA